MPLPFRFLASLFLALTVIGLGALHQPKETQAAPTDLFVTQTCAPNGRVILNLSWQYNNPLSIQTWFDVSLFNNGFAPGTFVGAGPLAGQASSYIWEGFVPRNIHYVRVNQLLTTGVWDSGPTWLLTTVDCPGSTTVVVNPPGPAGGPGAGIIINPPGPGIILLGAFATGCWPAYPDFCIPPPPPDIDCNQIPGYLKGFRVLHQFGDVHRLDRDGDGRGCV